MSLVKISGNASGTGTLTIAAPNTNTDYTLTLPQATTTIVGTDATQTLTNKTIQGGAITSGTAVASTSGTSIDFTGIPSWVKRITVVLNVVSTNGTSNIQLQLGDSGGIENTSYDSRSGNIDGTNATSAATLTSGFLLKTSVSAASTYIGQIVIVNISSNLWVCSSSVAAANGLSSFQNGTKTLSDTLTQVRITTVNGTDTFDAGTINILYE